MSRFPGNRFLALSHSGAFSPIVERARAITEGWAAADGERLLFRSERGDHFAAASGDAVALGAPRHVDLSIPAALDAAAVLKRGAGSLVPSAAPPLRLAWSDGRSAWAATDSFGIGQIFFVEKDGVAAFSTSATLLADIFDAEPDREALAAFALFGAFLDEQSPFAGVHKLAGGRVALRDGRVEVSATTLPVAHVQDVARAFRAGVLALADAFPDAPLELSGGLDSRLILAALPRERRVGRRAMTIGFPGTPDVAVAERIAQREGLEHDFVDVSGLGELGADSLHALLSDAVAGYDHGANPIDKAVICYAGRQRPGGGGRFGGQNGEILRGYYYPAQPLDARPSETLARRLVEWRLASNDRADPKLFDAAAFADLRATAEKRIIGRLLSFGGSWGEALDNFYLYERMQHWVGNGSCNRLIDRVTLQPFFDPGFVAAAMALPARDKANSAAAYRLLVELDPALASMPLDNGRVPAAVARSKLRARLDDTRRTALAVANRVRRKLLGETKATLGSEGICALWHRHRLFERLPAEALLRTGLFDEASIERLAKGEWLPDRPTLGFVLMMAGIVERKPA